MHPFAYIREIRSYVEGHGCRRPSSSQIWRFCKEAKLTLKTVSSAASFLSPLMPLSSQIEYVPRLRDPIEFASRLAGRTTEFAD